MERENQKWFKKTGLIGISACMVCCALPIIGAVAGIGALTAIGVYLEKIAVVILGIAGILFVLHFYHKRKTQQACSTSCDTDCDCKDNQNTEQRESHLS